MKYNSDEEFLEKEYKEQELFEEKLKEQEEILQEQEENHKAKDDSIKEELKETLWEEIEEIKVEFEELKEKNKKVKKELEAKEESMKSALQKMFSITEDAASNDEIRQRVLSSGKITGTNMVVMVCAILIASVGLNTNSVAVIIGAMLISPLMGSILAIAYGTATNDKFLFEKHMIGLLVQIAISVTTATIYFALSPNKVATQQLLARTSPRFYDVIIAVAGGVAGIVGQTRKDKDNNIIPGVAIATALMPPLCTCGYGIATLKIQYIGGAFYLFLINAYFIYASASVVLAILGTPHVNALTEEEWKKRRKKMIRNTILVLIPVILLGIYDLMMLVD